MANLAKSLGRDRDLPQLESQTFASASGGTASDPATDTVVFGLPDLTLSFLPGTLGQGVYGALPNNRSVLRQVNMISQGSANTVGGASHWFDIRINAYRAGTLQGCLAYYSLDVNTTCGTLVQLPVGTTTTTSISSGSSAFTVTSATNIVVGTPLSISGGTGTPEFVTVTAVSGASITATFANSHSGTTFVQTVAVNTTAPTAVTSGSTAITPASMSGIVANEVLYISGGVGTPEYVKVASITSTTFTSTFVNAHSGTYSVTSAALAQTPPQLQGVVGLAFPIAASVIPAATTNLVAGMALGVGSGATFEVVYIQSLFGAPLGFLSNFRYSHAQSEALTAIMVPNQPIAMIPAYAANTTTTSVVAAAGSQTLAPVSIYGIHVNDYVSVSNPTIEQVTASLVSSTAFTANFALAHGGTYNVSYFVATTVSNPGATPTTLTPASMANLTVGQTLKLQGTGADSAVSDTVTVSAVGASTITVTGAAGTYSTTANLTSVAYGKGTTTTTANKASQVVNMASTTGIAQGDLVALVGLVGNGSTAAFTGTPEVCQVQAVVTNTSITISPHSVFTNVFAVVPFTKTTSTTAVTTPGSQTITLASGTNFNTGQAGVYVWGGTSTVAETVQVTAVTNTTLTATFAQIHAGTLTITNSATTQGNNTIGVNTPFELIGGDVVTVNRISNDSTGIASPLMLVEAELVPSQIKA